MLNKLTDAQVGQTIEFTYFGGSNPGVQRLVKVEEVRDDRIVGVDLDKDALRIFLADKAAGITVMQPTTKAPEPAQLKGKLFTPNTARNALHEYIDTLEGQDLADVLCECQGGMNAVCDDCGNIVIQHAPPTLETTEEGFTIYNDEGAAMYVGRAPHDDKVVVVDDEQVNDPYDLAHRLCKHLGLTIA
ncbi:MAG: hypothetical protein M0P44_07850 [Clostridiales bacterium]|jgi:hypothetical protein|nr:hypothetical protein [Clostridiales bacterium]